MADTIDKVQIEIEAKAKDVSKVFEKLTKELENIKKSMGGFDTKGLMAASASMDKLATSIDNLASKMKNISGIKVSPKVDTSGVSNSEKKIQKEVDKINDKFIRLGSLANAALGGDASAITSFNRKAASLQGDIDVINAKIKKLGDTKVENPVFTDLQNKIAETKVKLDEYKAEEAKYSPGMKNNNSAWDELQNKIKQTENELESYKAQVDGMIANQTDTIDPFEGVKASIQDVQEGLNTMKDQVNSIPKVDEDLFKIDTKTVEKYLIQFGNNIKNVTKKLIQLGGAAVRKSFDVVKNGLSKIKSAASGTSGLMDKLSSKFDKGFLKVLKYGFGIRSLYVLFRRLRKVVVNSFGELQNSGAYFETTRANIEGLKGSLSTLGFQFGAAFEPIFNAVAPALQTLINYLISAMNVFSAFTAKLMGKDSYSKAVQSSSAVAGNIGSAAKSAKDLNKQLRGFDELNNLTTNDGSGGGGGGGSAGNSSGVTYVSEEVDNVLGDFGKTLAEQIRNGDWEAVGSTISAKLTEQINKINWDELKKESASFGTNLANFMNGLINPNLFGALGNAVGEAINTALTGSLAFAEKFNWENLGTSVATGINTFVATNPLKLVVANFNSWANGILDALITATQNVEWATIGQHIADAIGNIDAWNIAWKLGKLANSLANGLYQIVSNKQTWTNLGTKIADGINGFFTGMNDIDAKTGLTGWEALGKSISETFTGIGDSIITALDETDWVAVGQGIADFIGSIDWEKIKWELKELGKAFKKAFKGLMDGMEIDAADIALALFNVGIIITSIAGVQLAASIAGTVVTKLISNAIVGLITGSGGTAAAGGALVGIGSVIAQIAGVTVGIAAAATIGWKFGKTFGDFIATVLSNHGLISKDASDEYIANNEMSITQKIKDIKLAAETDNLKKGWDTMMDELYGPVFQEGEQILVTVKTKFNDTKDSLSKTWKSITSGIGDITAKVGAKLGTSIDTLKSWGTNFKSNITDKWKDAKAKLSAGLSTKISTLSSWGKSFASNITDKWKSHKATLSAVVGGAITKISDLSGWKKTFGNLYDNWVGKKAEMAMSFAGTTIDKVKTWVSNIKDLVANWSDHKANFDLKFSAAAADLKEWVNNNVIDKINGKFKSVPILKNHLIPRLATGGILTKATDATIGEAGTEAVVPLERNLGWLKKMSNMILEGVQDAGKYKYNATPDLLGFTGTVANPYMSDMRRGDSNSDLIQEQNRLLAEQNRLLNIIAQKDTRISSKDVFRATRREAQDYYNRTGNSPFFN